MAKILVLYYSSYGHAGASAGARRAFACAYITSFHSMLPHHGMLVVGLPYSAPELMHMDEISGGTPCGATTLAGADGARLPSAKELALASFQGRHVAQLAARMFD